MPGSRNVNTERKRYLIQLTGCPGSVGSDMEMPAAEQPQHSPSPGRSDWGRALALVVIVALCAGFVSGSCTGLVTWDEAAMAVAGYLAAAFPAWALFLIWPGAVAAAAATVGSGRRALAVLAPAGALSELRPSYQA